VLLGWPVFPIRAAPRALPAPQGGSNAIRAYTSESPLHPVVGGEQVLDQDHGGLPSWSSSG
jgi:hypothetical protein